MADSMDTIMIALRLAKEAYPADSPDYDIRPVAAEIAAYEAGMAGAPATFMDEFIGHARACVETERFERFRTEWEHFKGAKF